MKDKIAAISIPILILLMAYFNIRADRNGVLIVSEALIPHALLVFGWMAFLFMLFKGEDKE